MNRAARRRLRREAARVARDLAPTVVLAGDAGGLGRVTDPQAQALLRSAIRRSLRAGGRPVVQRLTEEQAAGFPHVRRGGAGLSAWLGVALGRDGRISCVCRRVGVIGAREPDAAIEAALVVELATLCSNSSVPGLDRTVGRC